VAVIGMVVPVMAVVAVVVLVGAVVRVVPVHVMSMIVAFMIFRQLFAMTLPYCATVDNGCCLSQPCVENYKQFYQFSFSPSLFLVSPVGLVSGTAGLCSQDLVPWFLDLVRLKISLVP
jgi:hypothetical protein